MFARRPFDPGHQVTVPWVLAHRTNGRAYATMLPLSVVCRL